MTGKEMTKEEISKAVEVFKPNYDIEKPIQELMNGHYLLCGYAYNVSKELMKYKMAFEILKGLLSLDKDTSLDGKVDFHTLYFTGELPYECYKRLTKEEYELLEELLRNEEDK